MKESKPAKKAWSGRFSKPPAKSAEKFTASITFDRRLYKQDVLNSQVYAQALAKAGILSSKECKKIIRALDEIKRGIETGKIKLSIEHEDIHMNIEQLLIDKVGESGKRIHTGRSRNDQVATDLRMYIKEEIGAITGLINHFQRVILDLAEQHIKIIMPGYTHLQRAQPILFSHYLLAYFEMLSRDKRRFLNCFQQANVLPLGSGALAGVNFKLDRHLLAKELGFEEISKNSIDAVSDRDFVLDFISASAVLIMHLSRFAEELVLWSSYEFDFIELSDAYTTGSSLMPQKKNPDVAELVRGKSGRIYGNLIGLLTVMKGLPLAYNKDCQEDKEPLFDTADTIKDVLTIFPEMLSTLKVHKEKMEDAARRGFQTATDLVYYLVRKGVPFRDAHEVVGKIIRYCEEANMHLDYMSIQELKKFSDRFEYDAQRIIGIENSIQSKDCLGGTATSRVKEAIKKARKEI